MKMINPSVQMVKRVVDLFPRVEGIPSDITQSIRRKYLDAVEYLRTSGPHSKWHLDHKSERKLN